MDTAPDSLDLPLLSADSPAPTKKAIVPTATSGTTCGTFFFGGANTLSNLTCSAILTGTSAFRLASEWFTGLSHDDISGDIAANSLLGNIIAGAFATAGSLGITSLSVSGFNTVKTRVQTLFDPTATPDDKAAARNYILYLLAFFAFAGAPMSQLADEGADYLTGSEIKRDYPGIRVAAMYLALVGVGVGISNALYGLITRGAGTLRTWVSGQEPTRAALTNSVKDLATYLSFADDQTIAAFNKACADIPLDAQQNPLGDARFIRQLAPLFSQPYPTVRGNPNFKILVALAATAVSAEAAQGLYTIVTDDFHYFTPQIVKVIAGLAFTLNTAFWSETIYNFVMNLLNLRRYIYDTIKQSSWGDLGKKTTFAILAACFGSVMALVTLRHPDPADSHTLTLLKAIVSWVINALVGLAGGMWVLQDWGMVKGTAYDHAQMNLATLQSCIDKATPQELYDMCMRWKTNIETNLQQPLPSDTTTASTAPAMATAAHAAPASGNTETAIVVRAVPAVTAPVSVPTHASAASCCTTTVGEKLLSEFPSGLFRQIGPEEDQTTRQGCCTRLWGLFGLRQSEPPVSTGTAASATARTPLLLTGVEHEANVAHDAAPPSTATAAATH